MIFLNNLNTWGIDPSVLINYDVVISFNNGIGYLYKAV